MSSLLRFSVHLFPLWAMGAAIVAYCFPAFFGDLKGLIFPLLAFVMLCMGMTLTKQSIANALSQPRLIFLAAMIQFGCMPLYAWLLSWFFQLPTEMLAGMVLVGASAGGTASNVMCYLANGNVALSVLMTTFSTFAAVVLMPALTWLLLNQFIPIPAWDMLSSIVKIVLLPVIIGCLINGLCPRQISRVMPLFPLLSSFAIILIIAVIIGLNRGNLVGLALPVVAAVCLHNLLGLATGYWLVKSLRYDEVIARTVAIEVGMQNSGLSVALALQYFGALAALPGALFSIWHNVSGSLLVLFWQRKSR